jgi:hypothetical protein
MYVIIHKPICNGPNFSVVCSSQFGSLFEPPLSLLLKPMIELAGSQYGLLGVPSRVFSC